MKIPDWLPDAHRPTGPDREPRRAVIDHFIRPVSKLLKIEAAGGIVLLACTIVALVLANSAWSDRYANIWRTPVGFRLGDFELS